MGTALSLWRQYFDLDAISLIYMLHLNVQNNKWIQFVDVIMQSLSDRCNKHLRDFNCRFAAYEEELRAMASQPYFRLMSIYLNINKKISLYKFNIFPYHRLNQPIRNTFIIASCKSHLGDITNAGYNL